MSREAGHMEQAKPTSQLENCISQLFKNDTWGAGRPVGKGMHYASLTTWVQYPHPRVERENGLYKVL